MKTMKHIIWMAALVLTAAIWSACSNKDELAVIEEPAQPRTYTISTTLSPKDGAQTRSTMTDKGDGSISAEWEVGDQLLAGYYQTNGDYKDATAEVTAVDPSTKVATITVTLVDPNGGDLFFRYPISFYDRTKDFYTDQTGTLADINTNFAAIWGDGSINVSGSDVTLSHVTMQPEMCIWKFSFTDGSSDITKDITKLVIDFPSYGTYEVTPSSLGTIYVALYGNVIKGDPICITATTATGVYRRAAASVTLNSGTTYTSMGLALKKAEVGKVFGTDGNIYDNAAATPGGNTAVALITYVGNNAETNATYNHGLALALEDANSGNTVELCSQQSETCLDNQYGDVSAAKTDMAGIANTDALVGTNTHNHAAAAVARNYNGGTHPVGTSKWFLPSAGQWDKMISAAGDYATLMTKAGLRKNFYWSSTERSAAWAWNYYFETGYWSGDSKGNSLYVRSALAF